MSNGRDRLDAAARHVTQAAGAFAVDASVMEADASRYHGKAPDEIDWSVPEPQTRAVAEFLRSLDDGDPDADRKVPKVISSVDPCSAWTAKANKRVQFGYGLNYRARRVCPQERPRRTTYVPAGSQNGYRFEYGNTAHARGSWC
jgi:hypothetical protein